MKVLVVGASGATGSLVVEQLLYSGIEVKAILRSLDSLSNRKKLHKIEASVHSLSSSQMAMHIKDCDAIISCLGHNLTLKGMFGKPRLLVTETLQCICEAVKLNNADEKIKVILMNTSGNVNLDLKEEKSPLSQRLVISIVRFLLPPHVDNENAANFLRTKIGQNDENIEWVAVRPDSLVDKNEVSKYNILASPNRNVIFDAGDTSRINVANFMSELLINKNLWLEWKGKMPVIYNHV